MSKIAKVYIVYEDGAIKYIEGETADKWDKAAQSSASWALSHSGKTGFEGITWKPLKVPTALAPK